MNGERTNRIWESIALLAKREASPMAARHACLTCVEAVGVRGAGLLLADSMDWLQPVYLTDSLSGEVEDLQVTLGQGPGTDALESGRPMLVGDLAAPMSTRRWPIFAPEAVRLGIGAMYSLPLALGAMRVGVLDLYHDTRGYLSQDQLLDALIYADTALLLVLDEHIGIATSVDGDHSDDSGPVLWHAQVHQAAGMISTQLGVSPVEALARLRGYAYAHNKRLTDVARSVVRQRLQLRGGAESRQ